MLKEKKPYILLGKYNTNQSVLDYMTGIVDGGYITDRILRTSPFGQSNLDIIRHINELNESMCEPNTNQLEVFIPVMNNDILTTINTNSTNMDREISNTVDIYLNTTLIDYTNNIFVNSVYEKDTLSFARDSILSATGVDIILLKPLFKNKVLMVMQMLQDNPDVYLFDNDNILGKYNKRIDIFLTMKMVNLVHILATAMGLKVYVYDPLSKSLIECP